MERTRLRSRVLAAAAAVLAASSPALAGPAHVLASRVLTPAPASATYAVSPDLGGRTREALIQALKEAGLRIVPADRPHAYVVTVRTQASPLCTAACSQLVGHDTGPLADAFRHIAVVAAEPNAGARVAAATSVAWYTYLQSDGLSSQAEDYLPALLQFGARAYGRDTTPEAPPRLSHPPVLVPNVASGPGA